MRRNVRHNGHRAKGLVGQLAAEKKKVVMALCLMGVMAFMWMRVLTKKSPEAAGAEIIAEPSSTSEPSNLELKITFIELPKVAGRHDVITRDVFASENWRHFLDRQRQRNGFEEVNNFSQDVSEEVIKKLTEKLKLEAVMVSENPQACLNGNVIWVGSKMIIGEGADKFECEVVLIKENTVVMKCKEAEIILKLEKESTTNN
ncbi:MAG: hypothetical protein JXM79_00155 [Sedimentisphaerales bacterium]|nr:hypothetical protein [Sedimentisphaerales bacterium]